MNNFTSLQEAKTIMGSNIITPSNLLSLKRFKFVIKNDYKVVPFSKEELKSKANDYYLIYGCSKFLNNQSVNIMNLKLVFGDNPDENVPCFYTQDWYINEKFVRMEMNEGWFLIRKRIYEDSRSVLPTNLEKKYTFPSAIKCTYSFFMVWLILNEKLWYHDFVWCCDTDHNGDRIYVGKYNDVDNINKDGFSIHRHLSLRNCYGCID